MTGKPADVSTDQAPQSSDALCPSGRGRPGAILLAVVGGDGRAGYVHPQLRVDEEFAARAHQGRTPEKRFRFAEPCVEHACAHWRNSRCGLIDSVVGEFEGGASTQAPAPLPRCSVRPQCRWYLQWGPRACQACPWVVTDLHPEPAGKPTYVTTCPDE